jgi:hypothetical protein
MKTYLSESGMNSPSEYLRHIVHLHAAIETIRLQSAPKRTPDHFRRAATLPQRSIFGGTLLSVESSRSFGKFHRSIQEFSAQKRPI